MRFMSGLLLAGLLGSGAHSWAEGFQVRLGLVHGHLREVFLGCADGATDAYDRGQDDMAPPPGIETGYTAFISPDGKFYLYRDVRASADTITWRFKADVYARKTVEVSWEAAQLPETYEFRLEGGKEPMDMRKTTKVEVPESKVLIITATRRKAEAGAKKTDGAKPEAEKKP